MNSLKVKLMLITISYFIFIFVVDTYAGNFITHDIIYCFIINISNRTFVNK